MVETTHRLNVADPLDLSIVVPVYNEEGNLGALSEEIVEALASSGKSFEIIYVDDGSTDASVQVIESLRSEIPQIRLLRMDRNHGQSAAMAAGFERAYGAVVVTLDADLQNDPADIPLLLESIDRYDVVAGWRRDRHDTWVRRLSSVVANSVRNRLSGDDIIDTGCSLKAFRREVVLSIPRFNGMHRFLPTLAKIEGFEVHQVPVGHRARHSGESKYGIRNRLLRSFLDLLAVRWMKERRLSYSVATDTGEAHLPDAAELRSHGS